MADPFKTPQPYHIVRATIWMLLFLAMSLVGGIVGYRNGYTRGFAGGATPWLNKPLEEQTYQVGDLAVFEPGSAPNLDIVVELVREIHMDSWDELGGPGTVKITGPNKIKIKHTAGTHETISQVFESIRAGRARENYSARGSH